MSEKIKAKMVDSWWLNNVIENQENLLPLTKLSGVLLLPEHLGKVLFCDTTIKYWAITPDSYHDGWPEGAEFYMAIPQIFPSNYSTIIGRESGVTISPYNNMALLSTYGIVRIYRVDVNQWVVEAINNVEFIED
jgi:hypothetical protein